MTKILIVDDEPLIRLGLESMIHWDCLDACLVGYAKNGAEGLEKIRLLRPHIVLTDIKMPVMDGIAMMQEAVTEDFPPLFIVLSSYNDFHMVKTAMKLGAIDYLMKLDLEEDVIQQVLEEACSLISRKKEQTKEQEPDLKYAFLREVFTVPSDRNHMSPTLIDTAPTLALRETRRYIALRIQMKAGALNTTDQDTYAKTYFLNLCKEMLQQIGDPYGFLIDPLTLIFYLELDQTIEQDQLAAKIRDMKTRVQNYFNQMITVWISGSHKNILHIAQAIEECRLADTNHHLSDDHHIFFYMQPAGAGNLEKRLEAMKQKDWALTLLLHDSEDAVTFFFQDIKQVLQVMNDYEQEAELCFHILQSFYLTDSNSRRFFTQWFRYDYVSLEAFMQKHPSCTDLNNWIVGLEKGCLNYRLEFVREIYHYKVTKAKQYIKDHRYQKITLHDVALYLEITPAYLSRIFKKVTRQPFCDYISQVKIEEAKQLLLQNNNKIYEVSSLLGYEDPYYFSKVFKKFTQMTPSEYIARQPFSGK